MYDINTKIIKKGKGFYAVFLAFGLLFLVIMVGIIVATKAKETKMDGSVISSRVEIVDHYDSDSGTMYSPVYYYEVKGEEYVCTSSASSSIYPSTENKIVKYDTSNPSRCLSPYSKSSLKWLYIFMILPLIFIIFPILSFRKINKRVKQVEELNQKGKLVKGLPYRMEGTGMTVNNRPVLRPVVDYTLPSGSTITLLGDPRHDYKSSDEDGLVDLVIDEANPENYFIDFEINRLTGNTPDDYYKAPVNEQEQNQVNQF